jgi:DNA mismatch repair protein MutL
VSRLGFEVEPFGETAVMIRSLPGLLSGRDPATLVEELAQELAASEAFESTRGEPDDARLLQAADRTFASLACHSARRAGDHLEPAEQRNLLEELDTIPWAPTCPHGRPVAIALDRSEIERRFRRR